MGTVEVYLARRLVQEGSDKVMQRETWRFIINTLLLSVFLAALYWHWGDLRRLHSLGLQLLRKQGDPEPKKSEDRKWRPVSGEDVADREDALPVDAIRGRHFQQGEPRKLAYDRAPVPPDLCPCAHAHDAPVCGR